MVYGPMSIQAQLEVSLKHQNAAENVEPLLFQDKVQYFLQYGISRLEKSTVSLRIKYVDRFAPCFFYLFVKNTVFNVVLQVYAARKMLTAFDTKKAWREQNRWILDSEQGRKVSAATSILP